ncbi:hypothetical protein [uncultured Stenotrophomonas sp.]|uniref:hypothetical protein n=1 Tax=uncultured Stenotrophomonas sp. TaxID=165438 RepID=UPI0025D1D5B2|nr:hypothetical protein [uncultured Stenotrophomonas sp.]
MKCIAQPLKSFVVAAGLIAAGAALTPTEAFDGFYNFTPQFGDQVSCKGAAFDACFRWDLASASGDDYVMTRQWVNRSDLLYGTVSGGVSGHSQVVLTGHGDNYQAPLIYARYGAVPTLTENDCIASLTDGCWLPVIEGVDIHYVIQGSVIGTELVHFYVLGV